jgi:hypothetical protein
MPTTSPFLPAHQKKGTKVEILQDLPHRAHEELYSVY